VGSFFQNDGGGGLQGSPGSCLQQTDRGLIHHEQLLALLAPGIAGLKFVDEPLVAHRCRYLVVGPITVEVSGHLEGFTDRIDGVDLLVGLHTLPGVMDLIVFVEG